jgi:hypothetical protein
MQLVAYGAQDVYLTGNPQITFFKVVYRRHTNFAIEAIEQTFNGSPDFGKKATVQITRNGDLVTKMYLKSTLTATTNGALGTVRSVHTTNGTVNKLTHGTGQVVTLTDACVITEIGNGFYSAEFVLADAPLFQGVQVGDIITGNEAGAVNTSLHAKFCEVTHLGTANDASVYTHGLIFKSSATGLDVTDLALGDTITVFKTPRNNPQAIGWVENVGHALISDVELQIGGTKIDKHYGVWMCIWDELTRNDDLNKAWNTNVGNDANGGMSNDAVRNLFVPLQFFCCRNDGLALPLIALQYHDVRLEFNFNSSGNLAHGSSTFNSAMSNTSLLVDYIYLDSEERKRFAQASHEYLIEQLQYTGSETLSAASNKYRLNFNHPCKELVWATKSATAEHAEFNDYVTNAQLKLNGHDRHSVQTGQYFNCVQPQQHHSRAPKDGIYCYSFALNPEEHQPSGSCNFSRIDNAELSVVTNATPVTGCNIYAVNYNVLRIMSGMGGLAYSN